MQVFIAKLKAGMVFLGLLLRNSGAVPFLQVRTVLFILVFISVAVCQNLGEEEVAKKGEKGKRGGKY